MSSLLVYRKMEENSIVLFEKNEKKVVLLKKKVRDTDGYFGGN